MINQRDEVKLFYKYLNKLAMAWVNLERYILALEYELVKNTKTLKKRIEDGQSSSIALHVK